MGNSLFRLNKMVLLILFFITFSSAKGQPPWVNEFAHSEFIAVFDSIQSRAVSSVEDFKAIQHLYLEKDIALIRDRFDVTAGLFNNMLYGVKTDLLDIEKRKFIRKYPEAYAKIIMTDLLVAYEFFGDEYMSTFIEVTDGRITGYAWHFSLTFILKLASKALVQFKNTKEEAGNFKEVDIESYFIEKHRFPLWDEIL